MSWQPEVDEIERRRRLALAMGGDEAVARQHERGRLTVRERIERIADPGSFIEEGRQAGAAEVDEEGRVVAFTPANYVVGFADVDSRRCIVAGEDFTQAGGSPTPAGLRKSVYSEELALKYRLPLVRFLEGGGGSVRGSGGRARGAPKTPPRPMGEPVYSRARFWSIAEILRTAPVASIGVGAVAGFPAARLVASHFSVMTRLTAQILIGGPALVERALGEKKTKDELGGWQVHGKSGVVDNVAEDEDDAMAQVRSFLSYLPSSVDSLPPRRSIGDPADRREERLLSIVPRDRRFLYDMRELISLVVDRDSFFEMTAGYGPSQITGMARVDGHAVGVVANDCRHIGGAMDAAGAQKFRRFVELCETFHLPILSLVDEPGFMIGSHSEASGTIRLWHGGDRGDRAIHRALVRGADPQGLRRCRRGTLRAVRPGADLAVGRERRAADRGRGGGRLPARDRGGAGPGQEAGRARGRVRQASDSLPAGRGLLGPRPDRPAEHPCRSRPVAETVGAAARVTGAVNERLRRTKRCE